MKSNFRITAHHNKDNLYLELTDEFDGGSAVELINVLKKFRSKIKNIIINTNDIYLIYPIVLDELKKECMADNSFHGLRFIGKHGNIMEPAEGCSFRY